MCFDPCALPPYEDTSPLSLPNKANTPRFAARDPTWATKIDDLTRLITSSCGSLCSWYSKLMLLTLDIVGCGLYYLFWLDSIIVRWCDKQFCEQSPNNINRPKTNIGPKYDRKPKCERMYAYVNKWLYVSDLRHRHYDQSPIPARLSVMFKREVRNSRLTGAALVVQKMVCLPPRWGEID